MALDGSTKQFELFGDFDLSEFVRGDESWAELLSYRNALENPSLSFYVDKVASKRWLPSVGFNIPEVFALYYADELDSKFGTSNRASRTRAISHVLPIDDRLDFAAKPTHKSLLEGNWIVHFQPDGEGACLTDAATRFTAPDDMGLRLLTVAASLAEHLETPPNPIESWALKNVNPGFVVEERWTAHEDHLAPPHEFNIFTVWGRVWVAQWNSVEDQNRWCLGFVRRDGGLTPDSYYYREGLPDWVDWPLLVHMAERAGANKDMFRIDVFVGLPWHQAPAADTTQAERERLVSIAVSEHEIFPTTNFEDDVLPEQGARLWTAGYNAGNYLVVPNTEVPDEFVRTGKLSAPGSD
jgi:hypothetical protein